MMDAQSDNLQRNEIALLAAQLEEIKLTLTHALQQDELTDERLDKARLYNHLENTWADINKILTEHQQRMASTRNERLA